jgi:phosphatidylinositol kinase/protein kinase (PI-3  family)
MCAPAFPLLLCFLLFYALDLYFMYFKAGLYKIGRRSCWALAQTYSQLPRDLFNAAFVSCWTELTESLQNELIQSLEQALMVPDLPEITQTILNLAEFMEHCDKVMWNIL